MSRRDYVVDVITPADIERAAELIVSRRFPWCRARLIHALAGALEEGVLEEVLGELLEDTELTESIVASLREALRRGGWITPPSPGASAP